jgi:hypothetical protein
LTFHTRLADFSPADYGRKAAFANATACQGSIGKAEARFKKEEGRRLRATKSRKWKGI